MIADTAVHSAITAAYIKMIREEVATHPGMVDIGICGSCGARQTEVEDRVISGACSGTRTPVEERRKANRQAFLERLGLS